MQPSSSVRKTSEGSTDAGSVSSRDLSSTADDATLSSVQLSVSPQANAGTEPSTAGDQSSESSLETPSSTERAPTAEAASQPAADASAETPVEAPAELRPEPPAEAPVEPPRIAPGAKLGVFELTDYIGGGGMGRVFRALDVPLQRVVAVKVLSREQASDEETTLRFRNEAQSAARLNHENIVQVFYVGEEEGFPYIVFEHIEGRNIRALVEQQGPLSLAEAVSYTFQIAEALAHAHAKKVVHRDIKPSNVLITAEGRAKLIDMGLARLQNLGDDQADLTASGVTLGTFDYISPEQARDPRAADTRSDIYSLGCTFFFMLTGHPPFPQGTVLQKLLQHQGEEPPDIREIRPDLPREVSRLLRRMMAKDPRRRLQTPAQLIEALALLAFQVGLYPAGPTERVWIRRAPSRFEWLHRHLPWIAPVAVLVATVLALNVYWSWPTPESTPTPLAAGRDAGTGSAEPPGTSTGSLRGDAKSLATAGAGGSSQGGTSAGAQGRGQGSQGGSRPTSEKPAPTTTADGSTPSGAATAAFNDAGALARADLRPESISAGISGASGSDTAATASGAAASRSTPAGTSTEPGAATTKSPSSPGGSPKSAASGVLIVDGLGESAGTFASLEAAVAKAVSGNVIELRYNGLRRENPLSLANMKLTIRAGEGFAPAVAFAPSDDDPALAQRAMIALSGGELALVQLNVEFTLPASLRTEPWSLIEARGAEQLKFEKCVCTIRDLNPQPGSVRGDAALVRVRSAATSEFGAPTPPKGDAAKLVVSLADCVVRGNACVLRVHDMRPVQFRWDNGLLATSDRLFSAEPGAAQPADADLYRVDLQHVTAVVQSGLCRLYYGDVASQQLPLAIACTNCLLVGDSGAALLEQLGPAAANAASDRIRWSGDRNFYEDFNVFWRVRRSLREPASSEMPFETWRDYWGAQRENQPSWNRVQWKRTEPIGRPFHQQMAVDYALRPATPDGPANPALKAANDGRDVGCLAERLPEHPTSSPPAGPSAAGGTSTDGSHKTPGTTPRGVAPDEAAPPRPSNDATE